MTALSEVVSHIDTLLNLRAVPDYPGAENGLQLANRTGNVTRILAAVDATLPVIRKAAALPGPALLLVHHGMFWGGARPVTGAFFEKLDLAMTAGLAIHSAHLPLDIHPEVGNNARLAAALGLTETTPFFDWKGIRLGVRARVDLPREEIVRRFGAAVDGPVHVCAAGPKTVREIGIITGGAGSEVAAVAATGIDTFLSGEGPHWSHTAAEELGVNLLLGGHYATETFGVKALATRLADTFGLPWEFLDHPTGL